MSATHLANLAIALAASERTAEARQVLEEAFELHQSQHAAGLAVEGLLVLAIAATLDGDPDLGTTLWGAATVVDQSSDHVIGPELDVYVADRLEPLKARPDFELHWQRGRRLDLDAALALGLVVPG